MSLFNTTYPNTIGVRAGEGLFEKLYAEDPATGKMERVLPGGGGGGGTLPYWVKPASAEFVSGTSVTKITPADIDVIDNNLNEAASLTPSSLILGDSSGNSSLTKESIEAANSLRDVAAGTAGKMLLFDTSTKKLSHTDPPAPTPLPVWAGETSAEFVNGLRTLKLDASTLYSRYSASTSTLTTVKANGLTAGISMPDSYVLDNSSPYTQVTQLGVSIRKTGSDKKVLSYDNLDTLEKLHGATTAAPGVGAKMLVWETDGSYRRADIPAGTITLPKTYRYPVGGYTYPGVNVPTHQWVPPLFTFAQDNDIPFGAFKHEPGFRPWIGFNLKPGDSVVFIPEKREPLNDNESDISFFYDVWYCFGISSTPSVSEFPNMLVEGTILKSDVNSPTRNTIDIKLSDRLDGDGGLKHQVSFRINGIAWETDDPASAITHSDRTVPFRGQIKFTLVTYDHTQLEPAPFATI